MRSRSFVVALALVGWLAGPAAAQTTPTSQASQAAAAYAEVVAEHDAAVRAWFEGQTGDEPPADSTYPGVNFIEPMRGVAERNAGTTEGFQALIWLIFNAGTLEQARGEDSKPLMRWALERVLRDHADAPAFRRQIAAFRQAGLMADPQPLVDFYTKLVERVTDPEEKAGALLGLGYSLSVESLRHPAIDTKRALEVLRSIPAGTKAGEAAGPVLFELENLQVGHKAPDVVGTDLDGKEIRLSQFLGQVVILDYWGFL